MVANFVAGGAAINVLARLAGAELLLVDAGVSPDPGPNPRIRRERLAAGTRSLLREPAMPREHAERIVEAGAALWSWRGKPGAAGRGGMGGNLTVQPPRAAA
jgi:nicotinate-nucleotide--dimethylbenzimidazole phosphoribosyltransferase